MTSHDEDPARYLEGLENRHRYAQLTVLLECNRKLHDCHVEQLRQRNDFLMSQREGRSSRLQAVALVLLSAFVTVFALVPEDKRKDMWVPGVAILLAYAGVACWQHRNSKLSDRALAGAEKDVTEQTHAVGRSAFACEITAAVINHNNASLVPELASQRDFWKSEVERLRIQLDRQKGQPIWAAAKLEWTRFRQWLNIDLEDSSEAGASEASKAGRDS